MLAVLAAGTLLAATAQALSPPPPLPIEALEDFYEAMNGDDWHRNDGWLEPVDNQFDVCDWYGITCVTEGGMFTWIGEIRLPNNNLSGELPQELLEQFNQTNPAAVPSRVLDLSGNTISGGLPNLPTNIPSIRLTDNELTGPLPAVGNDEFDLHELNLAGNAFEGSIPEDWAELDLDHLDLGDNRLEGDIAPAVAAMTIEQRIHLRLAGNRFDGPLPEALMALNPYPLDGRQSGPAATRWSAAFPPGLDLCWNEFDPPDAELAEFIEAHHHGGNFHDCQQARRSIDPVTSGSWFDPERPGEGFVHHLLDNGQALLFWFTFPRGPELQQAWHLGIGPVREHSIRFEAMHSFRGQFGIGQDDIDTSPFRLTINPLERNRHQISYSRSIVLGGTMTGILSYGLTARRADHGPLTRLAGSTCDNRQPHQWISGAWYDPERDGEGFMVEVNEDGRGAVYWFTYTPDDLAWQAWMMGDGDFDGQTLVVDNLVQPTGTVFGADFNPDEIEFTHWGSLVMEFDDDLNGHVWFDSVFEDYGSGDFPIARLARPMLAECE